MRDERPRAIAPTRRWLQFSLRSLLVLCLAVSAVLAWHFGRVRRERDAAERLKEAGAIVCWDYDVVESGATITYGPPEEWAVALGWTHVVRVDFAFCHHADDAVLARLADLPKVDTVSLSCTDIRDEGLRHVSKAHSVRELWLDGTRITDNGLAHLHGLKGLRSLYARAMGCGDEDSVREPAITEEGVSRLKAAVPGVQVDR